MLAYYNISKLRLINNASLLYNISKLRLINNAEAQLYKTNNTVLIGVVGHKLMSSKLVAFPKCRITSFLLLSLLLPPNYSFFFILIARIPFFYKK